MRLLRLLALLLLAPVQLTAQQQVGTIIVAHGGDDAWNALVQKAAAETKTGGPVEVAFLMGAGAKADPFQAVAKRLVAKGVSRIVVVPLLVSSHSGHYEQIRYLTGATSELSETMMHHLHMGGLERVQLSVPVTVTPAIDNSLEAADVLAERATALVRAPAEHAVFLVGHGPNDNEDLAAWMKNLRTIAARVHEKAGFKDVRAGVVQDDAPPAVRAEAVLRTRELIELQHKATGKPVVVVPLLISQGALSRSKLPQDLQGLDIIYQPTALLPHAQMVRWIERRVRESSK